jgi:hypothetical protein
MMKSCLARKDRLRPWRERHSKIAGKRVFPKAKSGHVFGQARRPAKNVADRHLRRYRWSDRWWWSLAALLITRPNPPTGFGSGMGAAKNSPHVHSFVVS